MAKEDNTNNSEKENQNFGPDTVAANEEAEGLEDNFNADAIDPKEVSSDNVHSSDVSGQGASTEQSASDSDKGPVDKDKVMEPTKRNTESKSSKKGDNKVSKERKNTESSEETPRYRDLTDSEGNNLIEETNPTNSDVDKGGDRPVDFDDFLKDTDRNTKKTGDDKDKNK